MDPFQALCEIPKLVEDYRRVATELVEAQRELHALKSDGFVPLEWVAEHWSVTSDTARDMIKVLAIGRKSTDIKVLSYGSKVVRYRRSDIERITNENLVPLKDMLAMKRAARLRVDKT